LRTTSPDNCSSIWPSDYFNAFAIDGTNTYSWDAENRLLSIVYPGSGNHSDFTYDGLGRNVKILEYTSSSLTSTKQFVWANGFRREGRDASSTVTGQYFLGGEIISGTSYYLCGTHDRSGREMTNSSGGVVAEYDYDPFGRLIKLTGSVDADFQFDSYYVHARSGLNLSRTRAYSANLGRWLNRDLIAERGGVNLFGFVNNNVVNRIDPFGLQCGCPPSGSGPQLADGNQTGTGPQSGTGAQSGTNSGTSGTGTSTGTGSGTGTDSGTPGPGAGTGTPSSGGSTGTSGSGTQPTVNAPLQSGATVNGTPFLGNIPPLSVPPKPDIPILPDLPPPEGPNSCQSNKPAVPLHAGQDYFDFGSGSTPVKDPGNPIPYTGPPQTQTGPPQTQTVP